MKATKWVFMFLLMTTIVIAGATKISDTTSDFNGNVNLGNNKLYNASSVNSTIFYGQIGCSYITGATSNLCTIIDTIGAGSNNCSVDNSCPLILYTGDDISRLNNDAGYVSSGSLTPNAINITTNFGGDVSGTYNAIIITKNYNTTQEIINAVNSTGLLINWSTGFADTNTYNSTIDIWRAIDNGTFLNYYDQRYNETEWVLAQGYSTTGGTSYWNETEYGIQLGLQNTSVGIGIIASAKTKLDIVGGSNANDIVIGGDANSYGLRTNNSNKLGKIAFANYQIDKVPISLIIGYSGINYHEIFIGGGHSSYYAATNISFWTAQHSSQTRGYTRMVINNYGEIGINTTTPQGALDVYGNICLSGNCILSWDQINTTYTESDDKAFNGTLQYNITSQACVGTDKISSFKDGIFTCTADASGGGGGEGTFALYGNWIKPNVTVTGGIDDLEINNINITGTISNSSNTYTLADLLKDTDTDTNTYNSTVDIWRAIDNGTFLNYYDQRYNETSWVISQGYITVDTNTYNSTEDIMRVVSNGTLQYNITSQACAGTEKISSFKDGIFTCSADQTGESGTSNWNQSGSNVYPNLINSNIGIGVTTPTSKLQVAGNINMTNSNITTVECIKFNNGAEWCGT